jgi:hypothetical protein
LIDDGAERTMEGKEILMFDTLAQIDEFRRFAEQRLAAGERRTVAELFDEWMEASPTEAEREADLRAIEESLRDIDAGNLGRPYEEFMAEFRQKYGLS